MMQVIGVAVFFALLLKPVSVEETEEVEQVLLGKNVIPCPCCVLCFVALTTQRKNLA